MPSPRTRARQSRGATALRQPFIFPGFKEGLGSPSDEELIDSLVEGRLVDHVDVEVVLA